MKSSHRTPHDPIRGATRGLAGLALLALALAACGAPAPPPAKEVIVPDTTHVLGPEARRGLLEVTPGGALRFATGAGPAALEAGDVLVSEPAAAAPDGLLRKVTGTRLDAGVLVVETAPAKLEEAVHQGHVKVSRTLTPADLRAAPVLAAGVRVARGAGGSAPRAGRAAAGEGRQATPDGRDGSPGAGRDGPTPQAQASFELELDDVVLYDQDGDTSTTDDQVRVDGGVAFTPSFDLEVDLDYDFPFDVDLEASVRAALDQRADLSVTGALNAELEKETTLARYDFSPIVVWLGPVPLVFTPKLSVLLGADGVVKAEATFAATQGALLAVGFAYDEDDGFEDIREHRSNFSGIEADFQGSLDLKAYAGVRFDLFLYGVVGPYGRVNLFLELDGATPRAPTWLLYGGLEGFIGINSVDVLDIHYDKQVLDVRREIARAGNGAPSVTIDGPAGDDADLNVPVRLRARTVDPEDGPDCCVVRWSSSVDGALGTADDFFHEIEHTFASEGARTVTATVEDSDGATTSATLRLDVVNTAPSVVATKPAPGEAVYRDLPYLLRGTSVDPNEPGRVLPCDALRWSSSLLTDPLPVGGCEVPVVFDSNGPRTLTLTGTDPQGRAGLATVDITVVDPPANPPPEVRITSPANGRSLGPDDRIALIGQATDPEGEGPLSYAWSVTYPGAGGPVTLPVGSAAELDWAPSDTIPGLDCEFSMTAQLDLRVSDPSGSTGRDYVVLRISLIC